jgi:hypothetical protein
VSGGLHRRDEGSIDPLVFKRRPEAKAPLACVGIVSIPSHQRILAQVRCCVR